MSLLSDLERHEKNPCNKWGRYSSSPSSSLVCDFSKPPENDLVQLITLSPSSPRTRRASLLKAKNQQKEKLIEIDDDKCQSKLRSNTDKNPKDFHARTANFTIPKTKKQTAKERLLKTNGSKKVATQLQLIPNAQGRPTKRTSNDEKSTTPTKKLRRPWLYAKPPQDSDDVAGNHGQDSSSPTDKRLIKQHGKDSPCKVVTPSTREISVHIVDLLSSQETEIVNEHDQNAGNKSNHVEEIRCELCDDVITKAGCLTCPKRSSDEIPEEITNSDEVSNNECEIPKTSEFGFGGESKSPVINFIAESDEEIAKSDAEIKSSALVDVVSSESQDSDFVSVPSASMTQSDFFCPLCGKGKTNTGCGCPEKNGEIAASNFYPRNRPYNDRYCGKKYGGKLQIKRKRNTRNMNKKKEKTSNKGPLQATLDMSEDEHKKKAKKNKVVVPKEPECVHISSDEDESPADTTCKPQENNNDNHNASIQNDNSQDRMYGPIDDDNTANKLEKREEKSNVVSSNDCSVVQPMVVNNLDESLAAQSNAKKQKVVGETSSLCEENAYIYLMAKFILVGELMCTPSEPVEVRNNKIVFNVHYKNEDMQFKLEKNNFQSFKIHSEEEPRIIIITPTPYWARKYVEKYNKFNIFIDPGSMVYNKKHIMLILNEAINGTSLEALIELIDCNLSDEPIAEKISQQEANSEGQRIISAFDVKNNKIASKALSSSSVDNVNKSRKSSPLVFKTYSTRSKSSAVTPSAPKPPSKKILVYQPSSKLDGVTITSEDMLCLEPSTYLNDVIIDFFFKYLIDEKLTAGDRERIHLFSTFFYDKLTQKNTSNEARTPTSMHRMVKSWTKNVDVFSKDFLIIPINESSHWYLVIICYPRMVADNAENQMSQGCDEPTSPNATEQANKEQEETESDLDDFDKTLIDTIRMSKSKTKSKSRESVGPIKARPCVLVFDSLGSNRRAGVISNLRNYLNCEWRERKDNSIEVTFDKDTLKACYPKVPYQENFSDCGLYVLKYFESFFTNPIEDYKFPINLCSWFTKEEMATKRQHIIDVIHELQAKAESLKIR